jgi:hypothetical protein
MIIAITEHFESESSYTWFCDTEKITPEFLEIVEKAKNNKTETYYHQNLGWQDDNNESARIDPPCFVEDEIELYGFEEI